jgi:glycine betaine/proline transport system substrate-binding protein
MSGKKRLRAGLLVLCLSVCPVLTAGAESIGIGFPDWPSAKVLANIIRVVAEESFELSAELVPGTNEQLFLSMDGGEGLVDIHPEVWLPNQVSLTARFVDQKRSVALSDNSYEALQGLCVTRDTADANGVSSVFDLGNKRVSRLFDSDGNGKGEVWIGAKRWDSTLVERIKAHQYGYADAFELVEEEERVTMQALDGAVEFGRPFVFYCYAPHYAFVRHDLVWLTQPAHDASRWKVVKPDQDPDWLNASDVAMEWPVSRVHVAYSRRVERHPELVQFLRGIKLNLKLVNEWTHAVAIEGKDPYVFARQWVSFNRDVVTAWLGG